jgi:TusA-related sulfurtransferase
MQEIKSLKPEELKIKVDTSEAKQDIQEVTKGQEISIQTKVDTTAIEQAAEEAAPQI